MLLLQVVIMLTAYCVAHGMLCAEPSPHAAALLPYDCMSPMSFTNSSQSCLISLSEHLPPDLDDLTLKATLIHAGFHDDVFRVSRDV